MSLVPTPGRHITGKFSRSRRARGSGSAGEIRVRDLTSPGWAAATFTQAGPDRELPIRCTGPRSRCWMSLVIVSAMAAIE